MLKVCEIFGSINEHVHMVSRMTDRLGVVDCTSTGDGSVPFFFPSSLLPAPLNT